MQTKDRHRSLQASYVQRCQSIAGELPGEIDQTQQLFSVPRQMSLSRCVIPTCTWWNSDWTRASLWEREREPASLPTSRTRGTVSALLASCSKMTKVNRWTVPQWVPLLWTCSPLQPKLWALCVDDTFGIWPHGKENCMPFMDTWWMQVETQFSEAYCKQQRLISCLHCTPNV